MDDSGHFGFTLVELLATLALIALLAGLAAPAMAVLVDKARVRSATQALAQELRQARVHALHRQRTVYFSLRLMPDRWCYGWSDSSACDCDAGSSAAGCTAGEDEREHRRGSSDFPHVQLSANRPGARPVVVFSPVRGTATAISFTLRNRHADTRVVVSPLGRIRICSPHRAGDLSC